MRDDILIGDTPKAIRRKRRLEGVETRGRLWKHATLADVEGLITRLQMAEYFTFTLVRNPWDRVVSYYHWLRGQSFSHPAVALAQEFDFPGFLRHDLTQRSLQAHPASEYMRDGSGAVQCDCYIRLEHFEQDARPLWDHLGFELPLPHLNASSRVRDFRGYYDDELRQIVARVCDEDIAQFDYHFDVTK